MIKVNSLIKNDKNPRYIDSDKLAKLKESIKEFPEMMSIRPIIVDENNIVLGGNMRLDAILELGIKEIPDEWVKKELNLSEEQKKEFILKDNIGYGEWDWEQLAINFNDLDLESIGLEIPGDSEAEGLGCDFNLPDGDKAPFQQITFTLADDQAEAIKNAIADIKQTDEYKYMETFGNENSNGNAIALIVEQWVELKK